MVWVALAIGRSAARALLYPVCLYYLCRAPAARRASCGYLTRALGRPARLIDQFRHFHVFASTILDRVFFLNDDSAAFDIRVHCPPDVEALMARGNGAVLLGAHMGSFEVLRSLGRARTTRPVHLVMYEDNARKLNSVLAAINPDRVHEIIGLGHCDSMLKVEACLERGDLVGLLADRALGAEKQVRRPFLGGTAGFPMGPFRIAGMLRRPIILMYGLYRGNARYDIHMELLLDLSHTPRAERNAEIDQAITRYAARLEHYCRLAPLNWFNFYDFWK
jgi:predicted LPLAT superfamily acyltransferase